MNPKETIPFESLVALLKKEEWYYQSTGADSSSSHVLDSTLAHCRISPVSVSQLPTATASSTSSCTISSFQKGSIKTVAYNKDARKVMNAWLFNVMDEMKLPRELAPISLFYIDRYVNSFSEFKYDLNIVAASALYLAIKNQFGDGDARVLTKYLVMVSRHEYSFLDTDIYQMELDILEKLKWCVNPPTSQGFLYEFEQLWYKHPIFGSISVKVIETVFQVANYVVELVQSSLLPCATEHPPSIIALASLVFAMKDVDDFAIPFWLKNHILSITLQVDCEFSFRSCSKDLIYEIAFEIEEHLLSLFSLSYIYKAIDPKGAVYNYHSVKHIKRSLSIGQTESDSVDLGSKSSKRSVSMSPSKTTVTATELHLIH